MVRISNLELIRKLKENARIRYVELAKHFGVSETAIRKRIKKLENDGVIKRYTIEVDPKKIGFSSVALIGLDTRPEKYIQTLEELKKMKEIVSLCSSSGDHMIMVECWCKDSKDLAFFVKRLEKIDGITKICPSIITEKIKC
ncbi:MAG: Lrp/AsnC family transcriptional regulator [Candidatus Nanoarchaeia archaeon]